LNPISARIRRLQRAADLFQKAGEASKKRIQFAYHNHTFEFQLPKRWAATPLRYLLATDSLRQDGARPLLDFRRRQDLSIFQ